VLGEFARAIVVSENYFADEDRSQLNSPLVIPAKAKSPKVVDANPALDKGRWSFCLTSMVVPRGSVHFFYLKRTLLQLPDGP